jgi:hypothetical protein
LLVSAIVGIILPLVLLYWRLGIPIRSGSV